MLTITITGRSAAAQNAAPQAAAQMGAAMEYWSVLKGSASWGQLQHAGVRWCCDLLVL